MIKSEHITLHCVAVSNQTEVLVPYSWKTKLSAACSRMSLTLPRFLLTSMGIGQTPFSVHVYAPERCQVLLQDQQLDCWSLSYSYTKFNCRTNKQNFVSLWLATFLSLVSMSAVQWLAVWLFSLEGKCSFEFHIYRYKPYT